MKKLLEFLGVCHSPNSVRGYDVTDRKQVWVGDYCYNYSLDSDCELIAVDAVEKHQANCGELSVDECSSCIRSQLGLTEVLVAVEKPLKTTKKPALKRSKKASLKKSTKKV